MTANIKTAEALKEVEKKLAAVEERLNEMNRVIDLTGQRRFTLIQGVICVFLGGLLTFIVQLVVASIRGRMDGGH